MSTTLPTPEGRRRYPLTDGYHHDVSRLGAHADMDLPCTCQPTCPARCPGDCGCKACDLQFVEFADAAGLIGPGGYVPSEDAVKTLYRTGGGS